jgi:hypothetical protein
MNERRFAASFAAEKLSFGFDFDSDERLREQ